MGILGYPNMDDNNQDGVFGDYSDVYSNYSEETTPATSGAEEYVDESFDKQAEAAANLNANSQDVQPDVIVEQEAVEQDGMTLQERRAAQSQGGANSNIFVLVLLLLALVAAGVYYYKNNMVQDTIMSDTQAMGDYFYDAAGGVSEQKNESQNDTKVEPNVDTKVDTKAVAEKKSEENMATIEVDIEPVATKTDASTKLAKEKVADVIKKAQSASSKKVDETKKQTAYKPAEVVVPVTSGGRLDPFMPYGEKTYVAEVPKFDIVAPPVEIPDADPMIVKMAGFKISGIMFDDVRPSAIMTIDGTEQLVHKGDIIAGYNIVDITRTKVVVKYNANVYEVGAGEVVNPSSVNINPVTTLNKQFGGVYTDTPENVIKFY